MADLLTGTTFCISSPASTSTSTSPPKSTLFRFRPTVNILILLANQFEKHMINGTVDSCPRDDYDIMFHYRVLNCAGISFLCKLGTIDFDRYDYTYLIGTCTVSNLQDISKKIIGDIYFISHARKLNPVSIEDAGVETYSVTFTHSKLFSATLALDMNRQLMYTSPFLCLTNNIARKTVSNQQHPMLVDMETAYFYEYMAKQNQEHQRSLKYAAIKILSDVNNREYYQMHENLESEFDLLVESEKIRKNLKVNLARFYELACGLPELSIEGDDEDSPAPQIICRDGNPSQLLTSDMNDVNTPDMNDVLDY